MALVSGARLLPKGGRGASREINRMRKWYPIPVFKARVHAVMHIAPIYVRYQTVLKRLDSDLATS